ncbi:MAG: alpha/beta fold hydrolase [Lachnospiraceae bacterium]
MQSVVVPTLHSHGRKGTIETEQGAHLYFEYYRHPAEKAAVVIAHGFCEFTAKYEEFIFNFYQQGYSVYIMDLRGHGFSERKVSDPSKVHIDSYMEYVEDLHLFVTEVVMKNSKDTELVLFSHSMGGAVAGIYLEKHPDIFSCAILSSPMLEIYLENFPISIVGMLALIKKLLRQDTDYVPGHKPFNRKPKYLTSGCVSKARYMYYFDKRLKQIRYYTYGATYGWLWATIRALRNVHKHASEIKIPVLIMQAGNDTVIKNSGQDKFASVNERICICRFPEAKHEIYNADSDTRRIYYNKMFSFIETWRLPD